MQWFDKEPLLKHSHHSFPFFKQVVMVVLLLLLPFPPAAETLARVERKIEDILVNGVYGMMISPQSRFTLERAQYPRVPKI